MFYVVLGIVLFIVAVIAVILSLVYMSKHTDKQMEVKSVKGEVLGTFNKHGYRIHFKTEETKLLDLVATHRQFLSLTSGNYGVIEYQGETLKSFTRLYDDEESRLEKQLNESYFFQTNQKKNNVYFYCDAPDLNISIPGSDPIKVTQEEVFNYINRLYENKTDHFFGLEKGNEIIQFSGDAGKTDLVMDVPIQNENASYQAIIKDLITLEYIVTAFFEDDDYKKHVNLQRIDF